MRALILSLCLAGCAPLPAQYTFPLAQLYGVKPSDEKVTLAQKYGTYAAAKAALPDFVGYAERKGWAQSKTLACYLVIACANDVLVKTDMSAAKDGRQSRAEIDIPHGKFAINAFIRTANTLHFGHGTNQYYAGQGSTWLYVDRTAWLEKPDSIGIFKPVLWADNSNNSYTEGARIYNMRLTGTRQLGAYRDPSYFEALVWAWDPGECSTSLDHVYMDYANDLGALLVRGTPGACEYVSVFANGLAGIGIYGAALNNWSIRNLSGDSNTLVLIRPGYGRQSGGSIALYDTKQEIYGDNTTENNVHGVPNPPQLMVDAEGGTLALTIIGGSYRPHGVYCDNMIRVQKGSGNGISVRVVNVQHYRVKHLLHYVDGGWKAQASNASDQPIVSSFTFSTKDGAIRSEHETFNLTTTSCTGNLGWLKRDPMTGQAIGTWNQTSCTPAPQGGGGTTPPTPTPCSSWTITGSGPCVNGQSQDLYTGSPAGCTGTPPVTYTPCTTPPPPAWTTVWPTANGVKTVTNTTCVAVTKTASQVRVTNLRAASLGYGRLVGTGTSKPSLQLWPDGYWYFNNVKCASTNTAKVVANTAWSGTIAIPSSAITAIWQTDCAQGGAIAGTCDKVELQ